MMVDRLARLGMAMAETAAGARCLWSFLGDDPDARPAGLRRGEPPGPARPPWTVPGHLGPTAGPETVPGPFGTLATPH